MASRSTVKMLADMDRIIAFSDKAIYKTSSIRRYNTTQIIQQQSVLEHEGSVALIAMLLSDYFIKNGAKLDTEKIMRMAIIHDLDEAIYGDIPYDAKYEYGKTSEEFRAALERMKIFTLRMILSSIGDSDLAKKYFGLMMEEKEKGTPEARIVKLADYIDVLIFINHELSLGNRSVRDIKEKAEKNIRGMLLNMAKDFVMHTDAPRRGRDFK